MRILKKNQVIVAVIGLMLIAAGYLNFSNNDDTNKILETSTLLDSEEMAAIGDATLVSTNPIETNEIINEIEESEKDESNILITNTDNKVNEEIQTNVNITTDEYFTQSRLDRDTMYSQMLENYQKILDKTTVSETQKTTAQQEITKINEERNAIMIAENLIKTKGFEDLIIFINEKNVNVIIKAEELEAVEIAQVQNIITRELDVKINNIHISNKQ